MTGLATRRLVDRPLRPDDLDDFAAPTGDPEVARSMDDVRPLSRELTAEWIGVSLANHRERGWGGFGVAAKGADRLIGFAGFAQPPDRPGVVGLIYAFGPDLWGRGYATGVAAALVAFGFGSGGMTRIEATVDPANEASARVLGKIGMAHEGRRQNDDGSFTDVYAIERVEDGPSR